MQLSGDRKAFEQLVTHIFRYDFANELLMLLSPDYYLGIKKFDELRNIFSTARYLLWNAFMSDEDYKQIGIENSDSILWMRTVYWQSSILWLNHCEDYVFKAIWFILNLHDVPKDSRDWYIKAIDKPIYYSDIRKKLLEKGSTILFP